MTEVPPITHPPRSRLADRSGTVAPWPLRPTQRPRPIKKERRVVNSWLPTGFHPWLTTFVLATFLFQFLLVPQGLFSIRTPLRVAAFGCSLVMLLIVPGRMVWSRLTHFAISITALFVIQLVNPNNNSILAACAAIGLNFAILSPVFWVSRLKLNVEHVQFLFFTLWFFHAASSCLGILEVYLPGRFSRESQISVSMNAVDSEGLKVTLADGTSIYRPMGLTDSPGGAAVSGFSTVLMASGLMLTRVSIWMRMALILSMLAGIFCIYVCQVRSLLIITFASEISMFAIFVIRGEIKRLTALILVVPGAIVLATIWAFAVGGEQVSARFETLTESNAGTVYYENRGAFLLSTIEDLQKYPFGAGLGRWGMVNKYFGDNSSKAITTLWAEIQPTAWLYDGGVLLIGLYYSLILFSIFNCFVLGLRKGRIADFATVVFGLNVATLVTTFGAAIFIGSAGLNFWLLNSVLLTSVSNTPRSKLIKSKHEFTSRKIGN